jgi:ABC-type glycerol-3-phosphate transport system permease component
MDGGTTTTATGVSALTAFLFFPLFPRTLTRGITAGAIK